MSVRRTLCVIVAAGVMLAAASARATSYYFKVATGDYNSATSWTPVAVPGSSDTAYIGRSGYPAGCVATLASSNQLTTLYVGYSAAGELDVNAGGSLSVSGGITLGYVGTPVGKIVQNGGLVSANYLTVAMGSGQSIYTISAGSLNLGGNLSVGGNGSLNDYGGQVTVAGTTTVSGKLDFGPSGTGTLTTGGFLGGVSQMYGTGTINTGGVLVDGGALTISSASGTSTYTVASTDGGVVTVNVAPVSGSASWLGAGYNGTGSLTINNGITLTSTNSYVGYWGGGNGTVTVDGATWQNIVNPTYVGYNGTGVLAVRNGGSVSTTSLYVGGNQTSGTVTVDSAGTLTATDALYVAYFYYGAGVLNLNGGALLADSIVGGTAGGAMTINFNGGTLKPYSMSNSNWVSGSSSSNLYVQAGGAKFDTAGQSMGISLPLQHDGSLGATPDGGLTKLGLGTLTLTGTNNYTGWTTVSAGTLSLSLACLADTASVRVDPGAVLDLASGITDMVRFLFLGGYPTLANVVYGQSNSGGYITGSGSLNALYAPLGGDADADGTVNGADLNIVLSNYNATGMDWFHGDFNNDGTVNGADLNIVLSNYNQTASVGAAVPEPSTLLLAAAGLAGLLAYAWKKTK